MTDDSADRAGHALERHDALEPVEPSDRDGDRGSSDPASPAYAVTTTRFDAAVTVAEPAAEGPKFTLTVRVPMLSTAARDEVGPAVEAGWFETLERRLADAGMATREAVDLAEFDLREAADGTAVVRYTYAVGDPARAADVAKTFAEYVEGTYVEGVVPGYEYGDPVAGLLARASSGDDGEGDGSRGPTPL